MTDHDDDDGCMMKKDITNQVKVHFIMKYKREASFTLQRIENKNPYLWIPENFPNDKEMELKVEGASPLESWPKGGREVRYDFSGWMKVESVLDKNKKSWIILHLDDNVPKFPIRRVRNIYSLEVGDMPLESSTLEKLDEQRSTLFSSDPSSSPVFGAASEWEGEGTQPYVQGSSASASSSSRKTVKRSLARAFDASASEDARKQAPRAPKKSKRMRAMMTCSLRTSASESAEPFDRLQNEMDYLTHNLTPKQNQEGSFVALTDAERNAMEVRIDVVWL
jgi:predicted transport protein